MEVTFETIKNLIADSIEPLSNRLSEVENTLSRMTIVQKSTIHYTDDEQEGTQQDQLDVSSDDDFMPDVNLHDIGAQIFDLKERFIKFEAEIRDTQDDMTKKHKLEIQRQFEGYEDLFLGHNDNIKQQNETINTSILDLSRQSQAATKKAARDYATANQKIEDVKQGITNTDARFDQFDEKIKQLAEVITSLMELERINVALDLQDDQDRKSINLIGVNEQSTPSIPSNGSTPQPSMLPYSRPGTQARSSSVQKALARRRSMEKSPKRRPIVQLDKTCQS